VRARTITTQPVSQTLRRADGQLHGGGTGTAPLSYQWLRSGVIIRRGHSRELYHARDDDVRNGATFEWW